MTKNNEPPSKAICNKGFRGNKGKRKIHAKP